MVWDARTSHQCDIGEEKDVSDQPFVCDQFHTGNRLSYFASYPRSRCEISGFGNRTGPSYPLRGPGVGLFPSVVIDQSSSIRGSNHSRIIVIRTCVKVTHVCMMLNIKKINFVKITSGIH